MRSLRIASALAAVLILPSVASVISGCSSIDPRQESFLYSEGGFQALSTAWSSRDGLSGSEISDELCRFVLSDPALFLDEVTNRAQMLEEWLAELAHLSFVDRGECIDRECMRLQMIAALKSVMAESSEGTEIKERIIATLDEIEVRRVN